MKNFNELFTAVANEYSVTEDDIRHDLRAYFEHLMEDPAFKEAWEEIPASDGMTDEELLLGLMVLHHAAGDDGAL